MAFVTPVVQPSRPYNAPVVQGSRIIWAHARSAPPSTLRGDVRYV